MRFNSSAYCLFLSCLKTIALVVVTSTVLSAQDPDPQMGVRPYASYHGGNIDNISLSNDSLSVDIPLASYPQRGAALKLVLVLHYENRGGYATQQCILEQCQWSWIPRGSGFQIVDVYNLFASAQNYTEHFCCPDVFVNHSVWSIIDGHNSAHFMADRGAGLETLDATAINYNTSARIITDSDGIQYTAPVNSAGNPTCQALRNAILQCTAPLRTDANGNTISFSTASGWVDTMGRAIPLPVATSDFSGCTGTLATTSASTWSLPGPNGGTYLLKLCYAQVSTTIGYLQGQVTSSLPQLQSVLLPDGTNWTFQYTTDGNGDLAQITFPTGGTLSYTWDSPTGGTYCHVTTTDLIEDRPVLTRTLNAGDGNPASVWHYNGTCNTALNPVNTVNTVTDPLGNDTVYTFSPMTTSYGASNFYEIERDSYQGSKASGSIVQTVTTDYSFNTVDPSVDGLDKVLLNVVPIRTTTILQNGLTMKVEKDYDAGFTFAHPDPTINKTYPGIFGKVVAQRVFDYAPGTPTTILSQTATGYQWQANANYLSAHLMDLVASHIIKDGSGNRATETDYTYDESTYLTTYTGTLPPGTHVGAPYPAPVRGNPTTTSRWLNTGGTVASHTNWYDTGEAFQIFDPNGNPPTTTTYDPVYAGAYPTKTCRPQTGSASHCVSGTFDFNTGLQTSFTNENATTQASGNTPGDSGHTTFYNYDFMSRASSIAFPDGGLTLYSYPTPTTIQRQRLISGSTYLTDSILFDGLGRTSHTLLSAPGCASPIQTNTTYDSLGRLSSVSNPYCATTDPTYGVTSYQYDALGRKTQVIYPDDSTSLISYTSASGQTGRAVQIQDEGNGITRGTHITQTDALGRLIHVCEVTGRIQANGNAPAACNLDIAGNGFLTTYQYDALNNLTNVQQSAVNRSFIYDSLSRLLSATNPESGTTSYTYDSNGNVLTRTRPAPNQSNGLVKMTTNYTYDPLNRLTQTSYCLVASCPTPDPLTPAVSRHYDTSLELAVTLTNTIGRLSAEYSSDVNGNLLSGRVYSYDKMGRVIDNSQCTMQNCPSGAAFSITYGYDQLGDKLTATNGMGMTLNYGYDSAARLQVLTAGVGGPLGPVSSLFSASTYNALGSVTTDAVGGVLNEHLGWDCRGRMLGYASAIAPATPSQSLTNSPGCPNATALNTSPYLPEITGSFLRLARLGYLNKNRTSIFLSSSGKRSKAHGSVRIMVRSRVGNQIMRELAVPYREGETLPVIARRLAEAVNKHSIDDLTAAIRPLGSGITLDLTLNGPETYSISSVSLSVTSNRKIPFIRAIDLGPPGQSPFVSGAGATWTEGQ